MHLVEGVRPEIADPFNVITQIGSGYTSPVEAIREYVSNSIDNITYHGLSSVNVVILFNKQAQYPRIVIRDDGPGIPWREFKELPKRFGLSGKRGLEGSIGEFGFGIWSYGTFDRDATSMTIYTRHTNDRTFPYATFSQDDLKRRLSSLGRVEVGSKPPSSQAIYYVYQFPTMKEIREHGKIPQIGYIVGEDELDPRQSFEHGTMTVLSGIPERSFARLMGGRLSERLRKLYDPLIRDGKANIFTGDTRRGGTPVRLLPVDYKGIVLLDTVVQVPDINDRRQDRMGTIKLYILRSDTPSDDRIGLYNNGVFVAPLTQISDDFTQEPFVSNEVIGFVNADFLNLAFTRTGVVVDEKYHKFVDVANTIKQEIANGLRKHHRVVKPRNEIREWTDSFLKVMYDAIPILERKYGETYGETLIPDESGAMVTVTPGGRGIAKRNERTRNTTPRKIQGGTGRRRGGGTNRGKRQPRTPSEQEIGTYVPGEVGEKQTVTEGRAVVPYIVELVEFPGVPPARATLVYNPNERIAPRIYVYTNHRDVKEAEKLGKAEVFRQIAKPIAFYGAVAEIKRLSHVQGVSSEETIQALETAAPEYAMDFLKLGSKRLGIEL